MNFIQIFKHLGSSWSCKRATYICCRYENSKIVQGVQREPTRFLRPTENNIFGSRMRMFSQQKFNYKSSKKKEIPHYFIFGGILSFFGIDDESKRERKYDKEIENIKEEDIDEKLRNVLRPAIINMQVSRKANMIKLNEYFILH